MGLAIKCYGFCFLHIGLFSKLKFPSKFMIGYG